MNKQIIIRLAISFIFIAFSLRVLIPLFYDFLKTKLSGQNNQNDIDWMIKKQKEQLKLQYGLSPTSSKLPEKNLDSTVHDILKHIAQHYAYTLSENKIHNFLSLANKRKFINFLPEKFQNSLLHKINFLSQAQILFILCDEISKKTFPMSQILAKKFSLTLFEFSMGVQIKVLLHMKSSNRTEDQVFCDEYVLHNFSEENISTALDAILQKEATLWSQSPSLLFEELALYFHYASILQPMPRLRSKDDIKTAALILGCLETDNIEHIKKKYKRLALLKHPDKITAQKLPPKLEKIGLENFNRIQQAYEILTQERV